MDSTFSLIEEAPDYFTVQHPNGQQATIPKMGTEDLHEEIRSLAPRREEITPPPPTAPNPFGSFNPPTVNPMAAVGPQPTEIPMEVTTPLPPAQETSLQMYQPPVMDQQNMAMVPPDQSGLDKGFNQMLGGINQGAQAQVKAAENIAEATKAAQDLMQATTQEYASKRAALDQEQAKTQQEYQNGTIDPNRFWNQKTGFKGGMSRVLSMIGLFLGGNAQIRTGVNPAQAMLQKSIEDDIDAQKAELGKKKTLLDFNMQKYGDLRMAEQASKLDMMNMFKLQLEGYAAQTNSEVAKANALYQAGDLNIKMAQLKDQLAKEQTSKQLNYMLGSQIIPDQILPALDKEMQEKMVRIGPGQNVMARSTEDAKQLKDAEPAINEVLRLVNDLETDLKTGKIGTSAYGDIPLLGDLTDMGREGRDRRAELVKAMMEVGKTLKISEYTDEKITNRLVPNVAAWTGSKEEEFGDLQRLKTSFQNKIDQARSSRLMTYNPTSAAPNFKPGVAK